jgi:hypothetical protein
MTPTSRDGLEIRASMWLTQQYVVRYANCGSMASCVGFGPYFKICPVRSFLVSR